MFKQVLVWEFGGRGGRRAMWLGDVTKYVILSLENKIYTRG
jgi:hypothetical protein